MFFIFFPPDCFDSVVQSMTFNTSEYKYSHDRIRVEFSKIPKGHGTLGLL